MGDQAFDPELGRENLERHLQGWFEQIETDFRVNSLNRVIVPLVPQGRVLDIGCGSGALSAELLRAGRQVVSQDPSERMLELCRRLFERKGLDASGVRAGGVDEIPERGWFDAAVALDVIEHIEDDVAALEAIRAALKPSGRVVLSVPALSSLYGPKDVQVGHYRRYDRETLLEALGLAGFEVESMRFWNLVGIPPVWLSNRRGKRLSEEFRYSRSAASSALNAALRLWFRWVEGPLRPPRGLTLIAVARPLRDGG